MAGKVDKSTITSTFFRNIFVHLITMGDTTPFFRSISVQLSDDFFCFPLHTRSLRMSMGTNCSFFRSIPVHFAVFFFYLRTVKIKDSGTSMAGIVKKMSLIKQVLQLKQQGESNRGIARKLPINKETVNGYMQAVNANIDRLHEFCKYKVTAVTFKVTAVIFDLTAVALSIYRSDILGYL